MRYFSTSQQWLLLSLSLLISCLLYFKFYHSSSLPREEIHQEIVIEIQGEIDRPGIYLFKNPPSLKEAIEKAGSIKDFLSSEMKDASDILNTGTLLTVKKESPSEIKIRIGRMEAHKLLVFSIPLDLNRASVEDLSLIPGIGESLAREIIAYRQKRKGFRSIEELKEVNGIGEQKFESIKKYVTTK